MKYRIYAVLLLGLCLFLPACDDKNGPSGNDTVRLTATLLPVNEVPPVTNADSGGSGTVIVTLNVTRDNAGSITGATADFSVTLTGFPAGTSLSGAHIHDGNVGVNGGIVVSAGINTGDVILATGAGGFTRTGVSVNAATANSLANGGAFYFNVHTVLSPNGAARGQLALQ